MSVLAGGASAAYTAKYTPYADALFGLGLFDGYGIRPDGTPDYRLEKTISRAERVVMPPRLLGEEDAALSTKHSVPFRDMDGHWAIRYVEYAYSKGYPSGTSAVTFSPDAAVNAKMYLTFLPRAGIPRQGGGSSFWTFSRSAMSETPARRSSTFSPTVTGAGATAMSPAALPGSASGRSLTVSTMGQTVPAPGRKRCRASS